MRKTDLALTLLRSLEKLGEGVSGNTVDILKTIMGGVKSTGDKLLKEKHVIAGNAVKVAQYAGALYVANKAYESDPVQNLVNKYREYKYRKAQGY